jgi:hypothetical protein
MNKLIATQDRNVTTTEGEWQEVGRNLPAIRQRYDIQVLPIQDNQLDAVTNVVNRYMVNTLGCPMRKVNPLERVGRVVLCEVVPSRREDPIVPVPVVHFDGWRRIVHNKLYSDLISYLMEYRFRYVYYNTYPRWWNKRMSKLVNRLTTVAKTYLDQDELVYYHNQLIECMANPMRKTMQEFRSGRGY